MCSHRSHRRASILALLLLFLPAASALPAAAQPARTAETAPRSAPGYRWMELWQSFLAPLTFLTGEGRGAWDPNGGDPADAVPCAVDEETDGRGAWDPNGNPL